MWSPIDLDLAELLLEGFVKRTSDRELVRPPAATPQKEVLVHMAMGGFVMHYGVAEAQLGLLIAILMLIPGLPKMDSLVNALKLIQPITKRPNVREEEDVGGDGSDAVAQGRRRLRFGTQHPCTISSTPRCCSGRPSPSAPTGGLLTAGIVLFSGTCYTVAYLEDRKFSSPAPLGGFAFIAAWASLLCVYYVWKVRTELLQHYGRNRKFYLKRKRFDNYRSEMARSLFCLCPLGWAPWSPRLVESVLLGCIPVIIADNIRLSFPPVLQWQEISLQVAEKDSQS
uniref:Exostosin GT47 domain-containing protein n=1 Tax=Zea mays TaxID=4577 RepID=A0A804N0R5_MAIZE